MMKNIENTENIQLLQSHINGLRAENEILRDENETLFETNEELIKTIRALKERCKDYSQQIIELECEVNDLKFTRNYLTSEDAGKAFAQDLLGNMTPGDIAEEEFISQGEQHYADTWNINCGDDF